MSNLNLFEMKKLNFFFFFSLFALTGYFVPGIAQDKAVTKQSSLVAVSSAIRIPQMSGNYHYRFQFDDMLCGEHTIGTTDNDERIRTFTMSAWIKPSVTDGDIICLLYTSPSPRD